MVSYAVYHINSIRRALCDAAGRGVRVRIVLDIMDPMEIEGHNPLFGIGEQLAACSEILYWPKDQRLRDVEDRRGAPHVKCMVADAARMFISSANLTEQGLHLNMELGIVIGGTRHSADVDDHFAELAGRGILRRLRFHKKLTRDSREGEGRV